VGVFCPVWATGVVGAFAPVFTPGGVAAVGTLAGGTVLGFAPVVGPVLAPSFSRSLAASFNPELVPGVPDAVSFEGATTGGAFPGFNAAGPLGPVAGAGSGGTPKHFYNQQSVNDRTVGNGHIDRFTLNSSNSFWKMGTAVVLSKKPGRTPSVPARAAIPELSPTHPEMFAVDLGSVAGLAGAGLAVVALATALTPMLRVPLMSTSTKTLALANPLSKSTPRASRGVRWPSRLPPSST